MQNEGETGYFSVIGRKICGENTSLKPQWWTIARKFENSSGVFKSLAIEIKVSFPHKNWLTSKNCGEYKTQRDWKTAAKISSIVFKIIPWHYNALLYMINFTTYA